VAARRCIGVVEGNAEADPTRKGLVDSLLVVGGQHDHTLEPLYPLK